MAVATCPPLDVPNLDDLSCDPNDYAHAEHTLRVLAEWCHWKRRAMIARAGGRIGKALFAELACDRIYATLPEGARW